MKKLFRRKIFWLPLFFIASVALLFSLGLDDVFLSSHEVRIGLIAELSGSMKPIGIASQHAVNLAINEVNAAGGVMINGSRYPIRLITLDNKSSIAETQKDVTQLNNSHVAAIIGPNVNEYALAAAKVAEENSIVLISPWSTDDNTTYCNNKPATYVFRTAFTQSSEEKALAYFASNIIKADKAAIVYDSRQTVLTQEANLFSTQFKSNHGVIVDSIGFTNPQNITQQLISLTKKNPDVIFLPAYAQDATTIIHEIKKITIKTPIIGIDAWNNGQLVKLCWQDCNGYYIASHMDNPTTNQITRDFILTYQKQFKTAPDDVAADSFDATNIILQAISKAGGISHDDIARAIHAIENFNGVTGYITYTNKSNDPQKDIFIYKVENENVVFSQAILAKEIQK